MSARLFTTVQKRGAFENTIHLARWSTNGYWEPDCGTRANNLRVSMGQPKQWITCEKCRRKLKSQGVLE
jgi:hypothetical protein